MGFNRSHLVKPVGWSCKVPAHKAIGHKMVIDLTSTHRTYFANPRNRRIQVVIYATSLDHVDENEKNGYNCSY